MAFIRSRYSWVRGLETDPNRLLATDFSTGFLVYLTPGSWEAQALDYAGLNSIWLNTEESRGWGIGTGATIHRYSKETGWTQWENLEGADQPGTINFRDIWLSEDETTGLAVGSGETFASWDGRVWYVEGGTPSWDHVEVDDSGENALAVGKRGKIALLQDDSIRINRPTKGLLRLRDVWISPTGKSALVVGAEPESDEVREPQGVILRWKSHWPLDKWEREPIPADIREVHAIAMINDDSGWALSADRVIRKIVGQQWEDINIPNELCPELSMRAYGFTGIWADLLSGEHVWVTTAGVCLLHWDGSSWNRVEVPDGVGILDLAPPPKLGGEGLALVQQRSVDFDNRLIVPFRVGQEPRWDEAIQSFSMGIDWPQKLELRSQDDSSFSWLMDSGRFWLLEDGEWVKNDATTISLNDFAVSKDGKSGWGVGEAGAILRLKTSQVQPGVVKPKRGSSWNTLEGDFDIELPESFTKVTDIKLTTADERKQNLFSSQDTLFEISTGGSGLFSVQLKPHTAQIAKENRHRHVRLEVRAQTKDQGSAQEIEFGSKQVFQLLGPSPSEKVIWLVATVIAINISLLTLAIFSGTVRNLVLHSAGSPIFGIPVGKYLLTYPLIRFLPPLKHTLFKAYRETLRTEIRSQSWESRRYVDPEIVDIALTPSTPRWRLALDKIISGKPGILWLVLGPSGLGKTMLLEQWAALALSKNRTPILIRLGSGLSPAMEAATQMERFGDIHVEPEVALDLLTGGGFLLLLDAFNEDRDPMRTRKFIRKVTKRNLVVLTSQFAPNLSKFVTVRRVQLRPFGPDQLSALIGQEYSKKIQERLDLRDLAELPFTAQLIGRHIEEHKELPRRRLDIYDMLTEGLVPQAQVINLRRVAWDLFRSNELEIYPSSALPAELLDSATKRRLLTRRIRDNRSYYLFAHERFHRYFVARYLEKQTQKTIEDWALEVQEELGREYWADVLDLLSECYGQQLIEGDLAIDKLNEFMLTVAEWSGSIFTDRILPQYKRLHQQRAIDEVDFIRFVPLDTNGTTAPD